MKNFKTESKKIMELMINSIYTNKEIFLRELISNASDALDKLYYKSLTDEKSEIAKKDLQIKIIPNKENRTLTISDNGIGMDANSLENNLGTIAKSGSEEFKESLKNNDDISIIGQFGVGFYSSFMVANTVEVISKAYGEETANKWSSSGADGYDIAPCEKAEIGTDIILHIKPNTENENFDKYLEEYEVQSLVKKYSDFIKYPILLQKTETTKDKDGKETKQTKFDTINTMIPLWKKDKKDIKPEEYDNFYTSMFYDYEKPLKVLHFKLEGKIEFSALLFIPQKAPYDFYTKEYEKGLKLYTNGVLITDKCKNLLPDYLSFVKGVVDADLPLNVSRETLQDSREVQVIANAIEDKVLEALKDTLKNDRTNYEKFFESFGLQLKYCIYKSFGAEKEKLQDLLMYHSLKQNKYVTLAEYAENKIADQNKIFYVPAKTLESAKVMPQVEITLNTEKDVLCLLDDFDEFAIKFIEKYKDMEIVNVTTEKFDDEKIELTDEDKPLIEFIKSTLKDKITDVKLTNKLGNLPVALSTNGELSLGMEKVLNTQAIPQKAKAEKVLKIKKDSEIYKKLIELFGKDKQKLANVIEILFAEAQLVAGVDVENVSDIASKINGLI